MISQDKLSIYLCYSALPCLFSCYSKNASKIYNFDDGKLSYCKIV